MNVFMCINLDANTFYCFLECAEGDDEQEAQISAIEFLSILKEIIRTFLNFVTGDKQTRCEKFRSLIKNKSAMEFQNIVNFLKKTNHKASHQFTSYMCAKFFVPIY
jgi:Protein of unknown function (DUF1666)